MKLSIFLAGIRPEKWLALYESFPNSTTLTDYEFVFVGPHGLPPELQNKENVRFIEDWGCPTRCYQLGLLHSRGEYVVYIADDGLFCPGLIIDKAFALIPQTKKGIVSFKYHEGPHTKKLIKLTSPDAYWTLGWHRFYRDAKYISNGYYLAMTALVRRDFLMEIGGFDCQIEQPGMSAVDLAIRLQNDGAEVVLGEKFMDVTHLPGHQGDHGPIHDAHCHHDMGLMTKIYNDPANAQRAKIDFDNWKQAEEVWSRRFTPDKQRKA